MDEELSKRLEQVKGTAEAKERLRVLLDVMLGDLEVEEACSRLKISEAEFHELRDRALQEMLNRMEEP